MAFRRRGRSTRVRVRRRRGSTLRRRSVNRIGWRM